MVIADLIRYNLKPDQKKQTSIYTDREKVKINKKLLIYLFFLLISVALWYLNALSKDYTTLIHYKVRFTNYPKGKVLISDMPEKLGLKVKGLGFSILKHQLVGYTRTIDFPIDNFRLDITRKNNQYHYFLLTRYAKEWLSGQLSSDVQLVDIEPDSLVFKFADVVERKVAVKANLNLEFEKQYMQSSSAKVKPDSILASGPLVMMDTLKCIYTQEIKKKHVKDSLKAELELVPMNKIATAVTKVSVVVPVEKYTELNLSIPIETINVPEGLRVRTFPGAINVSCWVGVSSYDKMAPYLFRATIDYNTIISNSPSKIKVDLVKTPQHIQNVRYSPKSVDYLIEK